MTKYGSKVSFSLKPPRCTVIVFLLEPSQMFKKKHNNLEINLYSTRHHSIVTHIILVKADQHLNPLFQRTQSIAPTRCTHQNHCPFPSQHLAINPNFQGPSEGCRVKGWTLQWPFFWQAWISTQNHKGSRYSFKVHLPDRTGFNFFITQEGGKGCVLTCDVSVPWKSKKGNSSKTRNR